MMENQRRFGEWDTMVLRNAMINAADIRQTLQKDVRENNGTFKGLGPVMVSSELLYHLCDSFLTSYEALVKENLIKTGHNPKISPSIH